MDTHPGESQAYLQAIMDSSPDPIFIKNRQSCFLLINPAFLSTTGKGEQEVIGHNDYDVFGTAEISEPLIANDRMVMETGRSHAIEERIMTPTGPYTYLTTKSPFRNSEGEIVGVIGIAHDISDRIRASEALRESEALLRAVLEQMPSGVTVRDARTREIIVSNARIREILGELAEYPEQFTSYCGRHPDGRQYTPEEWPMMRSMTKGETVHGEEVWCNRNDGTPIVLSISTAPVHDSRGEVVLAVGVFHDITAAKHAEEVLRDSEEKYRRLVETSNEGIMQVGPDLKVGYVNARIAHMLGYAPEEMIGRHYYDFLYPDEHEAAAKRFEERKRGIAEIYECRMMRKDGSRFWALLSASPLHDRVGNWLGSLGMYTDIHKRKQMERALRALNETLEQRVAVRTAEARRLADQLRALASELSQAEQRERRRLATILHDHIQQLLVAARLQLEWLGHEPEPGRIKAATQGIDAVLKEAIAASRSLTVDLSPPVLHQAGLVGGLSWLASRMLEKNQFTVHLRADTNAEPPTEEMRLLLFECVRELLFNAAKHSGVSESDVTVMRISKDRIRIIVQDLGKGFDPERLRNRSPNESTYGLFSIQQRLAHIGGHVEIETGIGRGTKVTITVQARPASVNARKERQAVGGIDVHGKGNACRVLIVDDHKILRDGLRGLLQFEDGIEVVGEAADGPAGIAMAESLAPDVIVMDINLKEMSGIEATRVILSKNPRIKVIGLSMYLDKDAARAMHEAGAAAYVPKGGPSEDLIAAIRACFHDKLNKQ